MTEMSIFGQKIFLWVKGILRGVSDTSNCLKHEKTRQFCWRSQAVQNVYLSIPSCFYYDFIQVFERDNEDTRLPPAFIMILFRFLREITKTHGFHHKFRADRESLSIEYSAVNNNGIDLWSMRLNKKSGKIRVKNFFTKEQRYFIL